MFKYYSFILLLFFFIEINASKETTFQIFNQKTAEFFNENFTPDSEEEEEEEEDTNSSLLSNITTIISELITSKSTHNPSNNNLVFDLPWEKIEEIDNNLVLNVTKIPDSTEITIIIA